MTNYEEKNDNKCLTNKIFNYNSHEILTTKASNFHEKLICYMYIQLQGIFQVWFYGQFSYIKILLSLKLGHSFLSLGLQEIFEKRATESSFQLIC